MKKNKVLLLTVAIVVVLVCIILFLISVRQFPNGLMSTGMTAIISAVLGVLLTVSVTQILLGQQSKTEEEKDKNIKVFEKKQEIYHQFLEKFKEIIQDGEIKIAEVKEDGT
ncbi:MAG: hypothetical protein LBQ78_01850, partial [Tannerellaceae bacterium]|nr:hypothetical protein [Tannerellaceae bacterium]